MAIAVTFTPLVGVPGDTPGTVSAALTGLTSSTTYDFTVIGPTGTYTQFHILVAGTTYTLVFPVTEPGSYTVYTKVAIPTATVVPGSSTYVASSIN